MFMMHTIKCHPVYSTVQVSRKSKAEGERGTSCFCSTLTGDLFHCRKASVLSSGG